MATAKAEFPRLRALDFRPIEQDGRQVILLRDPLQFSEMLVALPRQLGPVLALCDGTRDLSALRAACITHFRLLVRMNVLNRLVEVCDEAYLLENERFRDACRQRLNEYHAAPYRPPALAGQSYPADPAELSSLLNTYLQMVDGSEPAGSAGFAEPLEQISRRFGAGRGLVSPHIDYERGRPIYAAVWKAAEDMVRAADLAVILGTDHYGGYGALTLTRQSYATPFGVLPTASDVVDALAKAIGEEAAFAAELHHRNEHSIELAAVWLHHMRAGTPIELVPVLCGSYGHFVAGQADPARDPAIDALVETLKQKTEGRRVIVVASGDLSHVGPAFGGEPFGPSECARLRVADDEIMARTCAGDAAGFFEAIKRVGDGNNVCGLPPIYLALRVLGQTEGEQVAYDRCPADEQGTSFVSIGGIVLK